MGNLIIQNIDESVKNGLCLRAAKHGQSIEEEALQILRQALSPRPSEPSKGLGTRIHQRFAALGGVELTLPKRIQAETP